MSMKLNDAARRVIVEAAFSVVNELLDKWSNDLFLYSEEIDVQVELAQSIKSAIPREYRRVSATHSNYPNIGEAEYSRVTCEPYVRYESESEGNAVLCKPDIVIWNDGLSLREEDDKRGINDGYWPILFACEIKYKTSWCDINVLDDEKGRCYPDEERLVDLWNDKPGRRRHLYAGCCIEVADKQGQYCPDSYGSPTVTPAEGTQDAVKTVRWITNRGQKHT